MHEKMKTNAFFYGEGDGWASTIVRVLVDLLTITNKHAFRHEGENNLIDCLYTQLHSGTMEVGKKKLEHKVCFEGQQRLVPFCHLAKYV